MPTPQKIASPNKEQVRRWIVFDQLLRSNIGYSAEELLRKINTKLEDDEIIQRNGKLKKVSIRTIYNDLKDLQDIYGGKVTITKENGKYRYEELSMSIFEIGITKDEYQNLLYILKQARTTLSKSKHEELKQLIERLFNPQAAKLPKVPEQKSIIHTTNYSDQDAKWLNTLFDHISRDRCIRIQYTNQKNNFKNYRLCPLGIKEYNGLWYLVANELKEKQENAKVFRISRIAELEIIDAPKPDFLSNFNMEDYFRFSSGIHQDNHHPPVDIEIEVSDKRWANELIQRPINTTQRSFEKNGITTFKLKSYLSLELVHIIISMDHSVKVTKPQSLIDDIKKRLLNHLENYA
jgi:predicted DNA-binding transcriptional regulator YafY